MLKALQQIDAFTGHPVPAKITCPGSSDLYLRHRLFKMLDKARKKPLVWVAGPAGSGKTTLAASYLDTSNIPCLWYQLDEGDCDLATFFYYLRLAAQNAVPKSAIPLPLLTPEYRASLPVFTRRFFEALFARLRQPYVLVLDNYQDLPVDSPLHEILIQGLEALPNRACTMILSRSEPPRYFARLRANSALKVMGWNEIRLNMDESRGIMRLKGCVNLNDHQAEALHQKCEGWASGLILMLELVKDYGVDQIMSAREANFKEVFDYFAGEVFDRMNASTQTFLIRTAFLPKIHVTSADQLAAITDSAQILSMLTRNQYFTTRHAKHEPVYQYHQLFRQFLLAKAGSMLSRDEIIKAKQLAAALAEKSGQVEDAAFLLQDIQDWSGLIRLILDHAPSLIFQGRNETLHDWIDSIPKAFRKTNPWILYWLGMCKLPVALISSRSCLQHAFECFKKQKEPAGIFLSWSGIVETYIYEWGDMTPLDHWIAEIEQLLRACPQFPSLEIEAKVSLSLFSALMYRRPDHADMAYWEKRVKAIMLNTADIQLKITMSGPLIHYYVLWVGQISKAAFLVNVLRNAISAHPVAPLQHIIWRSMEGTYLWMTNQFEESHQAMQEGLAVAEKTGIHVWDFMILSNMMLYWSLCRDRKDKAGEILDKMSYILGTHRKLDISHYYYLSAYNALCLGDLTLAFENIAAAIKLAEEAGVPFVHSYYKTGLADILIASGEFEQADRHLRETFQFGLKIGSRSLESQCSWLWAILSIKKKDDETANQHLRTYLRNSRKYATANHGWWRADVMLCLYSKALEAGIETEHVRQLIRQHDLRPSAIGRCIENWPYPLKIYSLGRFTARLHDEPLSFRLKGQKKPIELLKALVAFGTREIKDEQLANALWPDADGESAHKAFTTTLYRLRKIIGYDQAILLKGRKVSLNPDLCWVDTWLLQRLLEDAGKIIANPPDALAELQNMSDQMISYYKGHFLEGDEDSWVLGPRDSLWGKVMHAVRHLGALLESGTHWAEAADLYRQWLSIDPLSEELYRGLIRCYGLSGNTAQALDAYQKCRRMLKEALGIDPSPKTEQVRRTCIPRNSQSSF